MAFFEADVEAVFALLELMMEELKGEECFPGSGGSDDEGG